MTNSTASNDPQLAALERVLDVFGSDPARWPEPERLQLMSLLSASEAARRLHRDAQALDTVLATERPLNANRSTALSQRILEAARREQATTGRTQPEIIPQPARERFTVVDGGKPTASSPRPAPAPHWFGWATAAALAASLVLGFALGSQSTFPTDVLITQATTETDAGEYAFGAINSVEEDLI